ncbi:DUF1003 domain-containing protein [archaeon]|jgi:uncharacterized membrane protein|nr:DUF1003 domain-containing protein [archaeon]
MKKGERKIKKTSKKEKQSLTKTVVNTISHPLRLPKTFGQKAADQLTKGAGSWTFILSFIALLIIWILANIYAWVNAWDPYPFILLNLALSCLAALQAPIILMSQNRSSQRDRQRSEYDYAVNRKAEREIQEIRKIVRRLDRKLNE